MAEPLPELDIPEELVSPVSSGVAARNADWALTFGRGATNLAQRRKQNTDLATYAQVLQESQAADMAKRLASDQGARDLWKTQEEMKRKAVLDRTKMVLDREKALREQELQPFRVKAMEAQAGAAAARERAIVAKQKYDAEQALQRDEDTAGLLGHIAELRGRGITDRSPDWASGVAVGVDTFRNADPDLRKKFAASILKGEDVEKLTPEQISEKVAELQAKNPTQQFRMNAAGETTVNTLAPKPEAAKQDSTKRLTHLENLRMKKGIDKDVKEYLDAEITKLKSGGDVGAPAVQNGPKVGDMRSGYRFLGGNPADKANWQKES